MPNQTRGLPNDRIIIIGENFNATRKIKATSPRVREVDGRTGIAYTDLDGTAKLLDCTDIIPEDPAERHSFMIPHVAQALRNRDLDYITYRDSGPRSGRARTSSICASTRCRSTRKSATSGSGTWWRPRRRSPTPSSPSTPRTRRPSTPGLEAHDSAKSRPAINSFNLENGRQELVGMAKERDAILFANASGNTGMPQNAAERVENLTRCMEMMDDGGVPPEDRFLDALVFPVGAGPEFGGHYLDAVRALREKYPDVHIFGGHSNVSFGLPNRKLLNQTFVTLSIQAGCDAAMLDPLMNPPADFDGFRFAADALTGVDEYSVKYLKYQRGLRRKKR